MKSVTTRDRPVMALLAATVLAGCSGEFGSGHYGEESREAGHFNRVEVSGAVTVRLRVTPGAPSSVRVTGDDNLLDAIQTDAGHHKLEIWNDRPVMAEIPLEVIVTMPNLRGLKASGACDLIATGIESGSLELDVSGAADVVLEGKVNDLELALSGASEVHAEHLSADRVFLDTSGTAEIGLCVRDGLDIESAGASDVRYWGTPARIKQAISGIGDVRFMGESCPTHLPGDASGSKWGKTADKHGKKCKDKSHSAPVPNNFYSDEPGDHSDETEQQQESQPPMPDNGYKPDTEEDEETDDSDDSDGSSGSGGSGSSDSKGGAGGDADDTNNTQGSSNSPCPKTTASSSAGSCKASSVCVAKGCVSETTCKCADGVCTCVTKCTCKSTCNAAQGSCNQ